MKKTTGVTLTGRRPDPMLKIAHRQVSGGGSTSWTVQSWPIGEQVIGSSWTAPFCMGPIGPFCSELRVFFEEK